MNPFRYCGEYFDRESDTIYLRARSYDPGTGRFVSEDFVRGVARKLPNGQEIPDPLSLHRYAYCHNNPVLYSDPSGEFVVAIATPLKEFAHNVAESVFVFVNSFSLSGGVGWGFGRKANFSGLDVSMIAKIDIWGCSIANGKVEPLATQEASLSAALGPFELGLQSTQEKQQILGLCEEFYPWSHEGWTDVPNVSGKISFGASAYFGIGASFSSEFDLLNFLLDFKEIWD